MKRIIVVRHGNIDSGNQHRGHDDPPMSDLGREQCRHLDRYLNERAASVDMLTCSTLKRAVETIECIHEQLSNAPAIGPKYDQLREFRTDRPDEVLPEFRNRVLSAFQDIRERLDDGQTAVVGAHGAVCWVTIEHFSGRPQKALDNYGPDDYYSLPNAGFAIFRERDGEIPVRPRRMVLRHLHGGVSTH